VFPHAIGKSDDSLYEPVLDDNEREAVSDLLEFLERVGPSVIPLSRCKSRANGKKQRGDADFDFYSGEPLRALTTLIYSGSIALQRSAALTLAEVTDRGLWHKQGNHAGPDDADIAF